MLNRRRLFVWSLVLIAAWLGQGATEGWRSLSVFDLRNNWALRFSLITVGILIGDLVVRAIAHYVRRKISL